MSHYSVRFNKKEAHADTAYINDECLIMIDGEGIVVEDSYHTMDTLYNHRHTLFYALCKIYDNYITPIKQSKVRCYKSKNHHPDNGPMFEDSFIVWMEVSKFQGPNDIISYHLPLHWWDIFNLMEKEYVPFYDGYSSEDVLQRIMNL